MADIIQLLPDAIANQIAAGEVVQRPASIVKELLENAIDAGATKIELEIKEAGTTYIRVKDNGKGMSETDARMCWERHATSKIKQANDLFKLKTFGFRGEALSSIAAVSMVEMKTKQPHADFGTSIKIEASNVFSQEPVSCSDGTTIVVKNLFYNIPARRNFLKSNTVEFKHITDEFYRVALINTKVEFVFINNNQEVTHLFSGDFLGRICQISNSKQADMWLEVKENTNIIAISGYIGTPQIAKRTRGEQFLFANGRFIKDTYFNHAINQAFQGLISVEHFPSYFLKLELDTSKIDVNVHPTKTEVKFEDSQAIYPILKSVIRKALGDFILAPKIEDNLIFDFDSIKTNKTILKDLPIKVNPNFNPFSNDIRSNHKNNTKHWDKAFESYQEPNSKNIFTDSKIQQHLLPTVEHFVPDQSIQLFNRFIIFYKDQQLLIAKQNGIHQRILFEQYQKAIVYEGISIQQLLFPRTISLSESDYALAYELQHDLLKLGLEISPFGKSDFIINGIPSGFEKSDPQQILEGLLENFKTNEQQLTLNRNENLAKALAKNAAIPNGRWLTLQEMNNLITDVFKCENPYWSPSGKPIIVKFTESQLLDMFNI